LRLARKIRLRGAVLLAAVLPAACGDQGSVCSYPGFFAQAPPTTVETLTRVCAWPAPKPVPAPAETGNVWPGAPERVLTMLDVQMEAARDGVKASPSPAAPLRPRGNGLCRPGPHGEAARGIALGLC